MNGSTVCRKLTKAAVGAFLTMDGPRLLPSQTTVAEPAVVKPLIIGHRGAAGLLPENTLAAFARACELRIDGIKLDVLVSADGELIMHHNFKKLNGYKKRRA